MNTLRSNFEIIYSFIVFWLAAATSTSLTSKLLPKGNSAPLTTTASLSTKYPFEFGSRKPYPILQKLEHSCDDDEHMCKNGLCILSKWICDSIDDCGDYSDEYHCLPKRQGCPADRFDCGSDQCFSNSFMCDGQVDCLNGADEENCHHHSNSVSDSLCSRLKFKCSNSLECIDKSLVCNKIPDCSDQSDEISCLFCSSHEFSCKSPENNITLRCIPRDYVCDNIPDCEDGSDEKLSECQGEEGQKEKNTVSTTTLSLPRDDTKRVTPTTEVISQADESKRSKCHSSQFRCNDGFCISILHRCDRHFDCLDGSDEELCAPIIEAPYEANNYPSSENNNIYPIQPELPRIHLRVYDTPQTQYIGDDVVFRCRDEGWTRLPVSWSRQNDKPFPPGTKEENGRLTMYGVSLDDAGVYICSTVGGEGSPVKGFGYLSVIPRFDPFKERNKPFPSELRRSKTMEELCGQDPGKCKDILPSFSSSLPSSSSSSSVSEKDDCVNREVICQGFHSLLKLLDEKKLDPFLSLYLLCHKSQQDKKDNNL